MRFVIPVVFCEITNVQCVYWSDTAIFFGRIYSIFYIRYNHKFRLLIMVIFRLYMKYLLGKFYALVTVHHERRVKREKPTRCN
jgi:hypothetical protein